MNSLHQNEYSNLTSSQSEGLKIVSPSLINKEVLLEATISHLESERDSLLTTVADLRQLIKRITVQQDQESSRKRRIQQEYASKILSLQQALLASEQHSKHFSCISDYWGDFIN